MLLLYAIELLRDEGEVAQFERIMEKYRRVMYNSAYGLLLDATAAEDAVTDAFIGVLRNFDGVKGLDHRELQNYLCKSARNAAISIKRKQERYSKYEVPLEEWREEAGPQEETFEAYVRNERKALISQAILRMDKECAAIIRMKYVQEMRESEIAELMKCSQSAVHKLIEKAKKEFARIYMELEGKGDE